MPVTHHKCEGYEEFKEVLKGLADKAEPVYFMFSGSHDENGKSWCPDCVKAKPVVDDYIKSVEDKEDMHFVYVGIEKEVWKERSNPFRTDSELRLTSVPTLMKLNGAEKLEEDECANKSMLQLFFGHDQ